MKNAPHTTPPGFWITFAVAFATLTISVASPPLVQVIGAVLAVALGYTAIRSWQEANGTAVIATTATPGVTWLGLACLVAAAGVLSASLTADVLVAVVAAAVILGTVPALGARFDRTARTGA